MWPPYYMPYPWPMPNPTPPTSPVKDGGFKVKDIRRAIKFYQDILKTEEEKKKAKDKDKKPEKMPAFNVLQTFALITIMGPFVGLTYLYFLEQLIKALTH